jgi:glycosyltransferase involved in cell wall biosynthesis
VRVAWVLYGGLDQRTGGTIYDAEVVAGLRAAGDDVRVVSLDANANAAGARLVGAIEAIAPDVIVGDELCFRELAAAFPLLEGHRRVLLVHHLTAWETELAAARRDEARVHEQKAIDASDAIVVTSAATKARLIAECAPRAQIDVVLPGADRLARDRAHEDGRARKRGDGDGDGDGVEGGTRIVFVGAIVRRKRVVELVRAFAGGASEHAQLTLVGSTAHDERYVREVREEIARRGIDDRVVLTGEVDERGVAQAIEDADVMVMPSTLEGYGIAATEAIYAGVPVIAARAQGLEEALAPCPDATLFADDETSLASALRRFAADSALRKAMIDAAAAAAPRMPTWAGCADAFRAALVGIAAPS